ncbi:MAG: fumarylacetoacetate hydrolase family protein [Actinomycetaceae bacterium]|nr:fumarylacetoacetate hydrolase family protein [Actinomycetaceae bacterium]MDY6083323.1 fumarylacetoacetate hydrolase family protein [Actinomycetaceae bacterium]
MKIARLSLQQGPRFALVDSATGDFLVLRDDPIFGSIDMTGQRVEAHDADLVSPMIPRSKVFGFLGTYTASASAPDSQISGARNPESVTNPVTLTTPQSLDNMGVFFKPNTSVIGPNEPIMKPAWATGIAHAPELAVVIGRAAKSISPARAKDVIFGYVAADNVYATGTDVVRAHSFDTSTVIGPWIETDLENVSHLAVRSWVDGAPRIVGNTADLLLTVQDLIAYASKISTLLPGDIILTGTPLGDGAINVGQRVRVEVEGIGSFDNPVIDE